MSTYSPLIDLPYATFYPHSMFVRIGKRLYDFKGWDSMDLQFWKDFIHGQNEIHTRDTRLSVHLWPSMTPDNLSGIAYVASGKTPSVVILKPTIQGKLLIVHIWRIQRLFRRKLFERRALPVMMASHPRLGERSLLGSLPADILSKILLGTRTTDEALF